MKISLITVCLNSSAVIRTAIESVLSQKGCDCEYLVIDGGSSDGTVDVIREYEPLFAGKMRWISGRDEGMYDALNKGIRMSTGEVIGILNADDAIAGDEVLAGVSAAFDADPAIDGTYGDVCFVRNSGCATSLAGFRALPARRYCTGRYFRPWMFRFGTQPAHPSVFLRRRCFDRWGFYSLDYGMFGDFELLCRFIWRNRARVRYLPLCTTVMRTGGASTSGWSSIRQINAADARALRDNGCGTNAAFLYSRYCLKILGFAFGEWRRRRTRRLWASSPEAMR